MTQTLRPAMLRGFTRRRRSAFPIKSGGPITALDWEGPVLRAAQSVLRGGKAEISSYASVRLEHPISVGRDDPVICGQRLAKALAGLKPRPAVTVMSIPRGLVFLRSLVLPKPRVREELAAMVHFQISKDLPLPVAEAVIDFQVNTRPPVPGGTAVPEDGGKKDEGEKVEVLVAIARREVVQFYERLAAAAGLKLAALGFNAYAHARGLQIGEAPGQKRGVALVSLSAGEISTEIVLAGTLAFSRTAPIGREDEPDGQAPSNEAVAGSLDDITIEVVRSLHGFAGLGRHEEIEEILLAGDHPHAEPLVKALWRRCQVPCRRIDPFQFFGVDARLQTPHTGEASSDPGAFSVLSQALVAQDPTPWSFDFLHPKRPPVQRNLKRTRLLAAAGVVAVALVSLAMVRSHMINQRVAARNQVAAEIESASTSRALYRKVRLNAKTVQDWRSEKREWLDHLAHLSAVLPNCSDVYVTSISTGARGVMHVSLQARSGDVLADIDKRLRAAGYDLKPLAVTPGSDRYGYPFQSSLELTLPDKMKIDLEGLKVPPRPADEGWPDSTPSGLTRSPAAQSADGAIPASNERERRSRRSERQ